MVMKKQNDEHGTYEHYLKEFQKHSEYDMKMAQFIGFTESLANSEMKSTEMAKQLKNMCKALRILGV
jgi:3-methyladenine DNA glycosylase Tag